MKGHSFWHYGNMMRNQQLKTFVIDVLILILVAVLAWLALKLGILHEINPDSLPW